MIDILKVIIDKQKPLLMRQKLKLNRLILKKMIKELEGDKNDR